MLVSANREYLPSEFCVMQQEHADHNHHRKNDDRNRNHANRSFSNKRICVGKACDRPPIRIDICKPPAYGHCGKRGDKRGDLHFCNKEACERAHCKSDQNAKEHRKSYWELRAFPGKACGDDRAHCYDRAYREVDSACNNNERHAHADNPDDGDLPQHIDQVICGEEHRRRERARDKQYQKRQVYRIFSK